MADLLSTFMLHPMTLARWQQMLLLLPLCLCVSTVYKTTKCATVREIPMAVLEPKERDAKPTAPAPLKRFDNRRIVLTAAFSPDGKTLAAGGGEGIVRLWDVSAGEVRRELKGHHGWVRSLAYSPDGRTLATGGKDGYVVLWDPNTGENRGPLGKHVQDVVDVSFSPDGGWLATF